MEVQSIAKSSEKDAWIFIEETIQEELQLANNSDE